MIHPQTETRYSGPGIGHGVFSTAPIPRGTLVYVKDPLEIHVSPAEYAGSTPGLRRLIERYSYMESTGVRVLSWDAAKYVNHSCEPNTMSTGWGVEIAVRDIDEGEEITDEYGMFNLIRPMVCECRSSACRGMISGSDLHALHVPWDQAICAALELAPHVSQPLLENFTGADALALNDYFSGASPYRSVRGLARPEPLTVTRRNGAARHNRAQRSR